MDVGTGGNTPCPLGLQFAGVEPTSWTARLVRGRPVLEVDYGMSEYDNPEFTPGQLPPSGQPPSLPESLSVAVSVGRSEKELDDARQELQPGSSDYEKRRSDFYGLTLSSADGVAELDKPAVSCELG